MKRLSTVFLSFLLAVVMLFTITSYVLASDESTESATTKNLYRYREKIETTTRVPLESPWTLISQTSSMQLLREYNSLDPKELSEIEEEYSNDCYYTSKIVDGSMVKYTTNPHGGIAYYFDKALPDYGMYDESQYTYSEHPVTGIKLYYRGVCDTYTLNVYTRYEYNYWNWSEWSAWSETPYIASETVEVETKESNILYRYREKQYTNSKTTLDEPWVLYNTTTEYVHNGTQTIVLDEDKTIDSSYCVHKKERVNEYVKPGGGSSFYATSSEYLDMLKNNSSLNTYTPYSGYFRYTCCTSKNPYTLYHYYMWSEWSEWSYTPVEESENVEVETKVGKTFTITYDANGGTGVPPSTIKGFDETITLSSIIPIRENYDFLGWSTSPEGDVEYVGGEEYSTNADITLYAVWKNITEYTVTYDPNGGSNAPSQQIKLHDETVEISSEIPTMEGHSFLGWSTTSSGEEEYTIGDIYSNNESVILYAVWKANTYKISYDANGGNASPDYQIKTYGEDLVLSPIEPTRDGYKFLGWSTTKDGNVQYVPGDTYFNNESLLLYAVWEDLIIASGKCYYNLTWTLLRDGTLVISGNGYIECCSTSEIPWYDYRYQIKALVVEDGVTSIYGNAFYKCSNMTKVTIKGNSLQYIDAQAFAFCEDITSVYITDPTAWCKVEFGDSYADPRYYADYFYIIDNDGSFIRDVILDNTLDEIPEGAFRKCRYLESIVIPNSVTSIGGSAFANCENLKEIKFQGTLSKLGASAFYDCSYLNKIEIPEGVTTIEKSTFYNCRRLTNVILPSSISSIQSNAFMDCVSLKEIQIPKKLTTIESSAFSACHSLKTVFLPRALSSIKNDAFYNCSDLQTVYYCGSEAEWKNITMGLYNDDLTNANIHYNYEYEIPTKIYATGITFDKSSVTLDVGANEILIATIAPADATNQNVLWTSSNTSVATVENGTVTAVSAGTATITATTEDGGYTATCTVTVNEPEPPTISVTGITFDKSSVTLDVGANETLIATIAPANATNKNVVWTSSNTSVATVENGTVTAVGAGTATITVTTEDGGYTATCTVTVNEPEPPTIFATGITVDKSSVTLDVGANETLIATIAPANATNKNVVWTSSNTSVATVENGTVTAVGSGTATITVTAEDGGYTTTCMVTVNEVEIPPVIDENAPMVKVESVKGKAGEPITVPLYIENNPGVLGMMLKVSYDEELTLTALTQSTGEDNSALESLDFTPGKDLTANPINVGWDGLDADSTNGKILNMTFTIPEDAEDGKVYDVKISYSIGDVYDNDFNDIDLAVIDGSITVKNYTIGDVNDDGTINMKDVTLLRRGVIGGYGVTLNEAADVNCDGVTNMKDVTILRRYVIGGYGVTLG